MKKYMMMTVLGICLLIGSLYPRMILRQHLVLVDEQGQVITQEDNIDPEIPLELHFRFLELWNLRQEMK
ncbi:MAG: hypothetical protein ACI4DV_01060 [Lachnospiraceae bacterium]